MKVPFSPPYIDDDIKQEVLSALDSGWITTGPRVHALQKEVACFCKAEAALGVSSATAGMQLVLHWFGIQPGDEVIVPAYTYCATALAAIHAGATIKMVDVSDDFTIDVAKIEAAITNRTKAIIMVDFAGWPCNYTGVYQLVNRECVKKRFSPQTEAQQALQRILIIADAAHSFGASCNGRRTGTLADITVFSFHAVKNLTTAEGGMICFNMPAPFRNSEIYNLLRVWSLNGQTKDAFTKSLSGGWKYDIVYPGFKMNLSDIHAAIGLAQFKKFKDNLLIERKRVFNRYQAALKKHEWALLPPFEREGCESAYHLYPLRISGISEAQRDEIINEMAKNDIAVNVHFIPLPMLTMFKQSGFRIEDYPQSYTLYCTEVSLPVYPQLSNEVCDDIIATLTDAIQSVLNNDER